MSDWQNEDEIKAELRTLTKELRQLREELRNMVAPPKPNPARSLLHRQSWPPAPHDQPVGGANDAKPPQPRRKK